MNEMGARRDFVIEGLCPLAPTGKSARGSTPWFAPAPNQTSSSRYFTSRLIQRQNRSVLNVTATKAEG